MRWDVFGTWVEQHGGFDRPLVLAIDEAQRFDRGPEDPLAKLLQSLHDGCGLPITLVLAGLSDTEHSASKMDLTHIPAGQIHNIGRFPEPEAEEFMARSCAHFGIDFSGYEDEIGRLAASCDGWPRHLHIALQALGKEALQTDGDLGEVAWKRIHDESNTGREGYYGHQFSSEMREAKSLTVQIMAALDTRHGREEILKLINKCREDSANYVFPEGMSTTEFFVHLVHKGALHEESVDWFVCPIPSFRTYLLDQGGIAENPSSIPDSAGSVDGPVGDSNR